MLPASVRSPPFASRPAAARGSRRRPFLKGVCQRANEPNRRQARRGLGFSSFFAALLLAACAEPPAPPPPPPVEVGVIDVEPRELTLVARVPRAAQRRARGRGSRARVGHPARAPLRRRRARRGRRDAVPHRSRSVSRARSRKRTLRSTCRKPTSVRRAASATASCRFTSRSSRACAIATRRSRRSRAPRRPSPPRVPRCARPSSSCRTRKFARRSRG